MALQNSLKGISHDGYDLGAQRREIKGSEIADVINVFKSYKLGVDLNDHRNTVVAKKTDIAQQDFVLTGDRYIKKQVIISTWPMLSLGECCELRVGGTPSKQMDAFWENGTIKWISSKHISDQGIITSYELITNEALASSATKIAPKGSTILVTRVSVGKAAYADFDYAINQDMTCLIPDERINPRYLFLISPQLTEWIARDAQGIGVKGVTQKYVSELRIPVPPLNVQAEIVAEIESHQSRIVEYENRIAEETGAIKNAIAKVWGE